MMNATKAHKRNTITHDDVEEVDDELEEVGSSRQSCANRSCTAREGRHANGVVAGDSRRSKRHVRGGGTRQECKDGGATTRTISHRMPAGCAQPGAPHTDAKQRPPQLQKVGATGCNVGGATNRTTERGPQMRGASKDECVSTPNAQDLTSKWRSRNVA
jgi:hypothetical protein